MDNELLGDDMLLLTLLGLWLLIAAACNTMLRSGGMLTLLKVWYVLLCVWEYFAPTRRKARRQ